MPNDPLQYTYSSGGLGSLSASSLVAADLPMKRWRCTHGHRWESPVKRVGIYLDGTIWGDPDKPLEFCPICIVELLKERVGQVREDP